MPGQCHTPALLMARHRLGPPSTTRHFDGALGHDQRVPSLPCQVVRWVRDEPNPGWVEVQFTDAHGEVWHFFDKPPIFERADGAPLTRATSYPVDIEMPVTVSETRESDLGVVAVIALPWGLDYDLAQDAFEVLPDRLRNY